jgi:hypothetical protein
MGNWLRKEGPMGKQAPASLFIGDVVKELERGYRRLNTELFDSQLPESVTILIQSQGRRNALGWYWHAGWVNGSGKTATPEITITAESLNRADPKDDDSVGETLIHEMIHGLEQVLDVKGGRMPYHNKHFKALAEAHGLSCEDRPDPRHGFGFTKLDRRGRSALRRIRFKWQLFNRHMIDHSGRTKQPTKMKKWVCDCDCQGRPTIVRCAINLDAECSLCGEVFERA